MTTGTTGSDERLVRAVDASSDGLLMVDADGSVVLANGTAARLLGRTPEDLGGAPFGIPLVGDRTEVELLGVDGSVIVVEMRATETTWDGQEVAVVALHDVSDYSEQIHHLSEAIARKDAVVANITHELRNPITIITGFAETLSRHWDSLEDAHRRQLVQRIHLTGERMGATVENLLKLSRLDAGESALQPDRVEISRLLFSRLFELGDRAKLIQMSCAPGSAVWADEEHVWEILVNFLENAFKYGRPPFEIDGRPVGDNVEIRVRDHGEGVPPEFVPNLFGRFARAPETAGEIDGSGLGLSITQALARANGGDCRYDDRFDGACFVITLPSAAAHESAFGGNDTTTVHGSRT